MSVGFRAVQWNRDKLVYDGLLLAAVALYIVGFVVVEARLEPPRTRWARSTCASAPSAVPPS